ncbi:MAG: helicase-associated domain-containing protein [Spirochaetota bacterium]
MNLDHNKPLIVQGDRSILMEVNSPYFEKARDSLLRSAELEKSPEYVHACRITPISLWNAASSGIMEELGWFARGLLY